MIPLALVHARDAAELVGVFGLAAGGWFSWDHLRRRDARRRVERLERQAAYELAVTRRQKEWEQAQRYFGTGVR